MDEFEEDGPIVSVIKVFPEMRFAKWLVLKGFPEYSTCVWFIWFWQYCIQIYKQRWSSDTEQGYCA